MPVIGARAKTENGQASTQRVLLRRVSRNCIDSDAEGEMTDRAEVLNLRMVVAALIEKMGGEVLLTRADLADAAMLTVWNRQFLRELARVLRGM
jgi:hypothetical protein